MDASEKVKFLTATMALSAAYLYANADKKKKRKKRETWVKPWLQRREEKGTYHNLLQELRVEDVHAYRRFLRMNPETFEVRAYYHLEKVRTQGKREGGSTLTFS